MSRAQIRRREQSRHANDKQGLDSPRAWNLDQVADACHSVSSSHVTIDVLEFTRISSLMQSARQFSFFRCLEFVTSSTARRRGLHHVFFSKVLCLKFLILMLRSASLSFCPSFRRAVRDRRKAFGAAPFRSTDRFVFTRQRPGRAHCNEHGYAIRVAVFFLRRIQFVIKSTDKERGCCHASYFKVLCLKFLFLMYCAPRG